MGDTTDFRVKATFRNREDLERAVQRLKAGGFSHDRISVLLPTRKEEDPAEDAAATGEGAAVGALFGGTLGWLASLATLAVPGAGPFVVAGPLLSLLTGAGAGGVIGALVGLGLSDSEAADAERRSRHGEGLIVVHCDSEKERDSAHAILSDCGPTDLTLLNPETRGDRPKFAQSIEKLNESSPDPDDIRLRAWMIWNREGRPKDRAMDHWARAERELRSRR